MQLKPKIASALVAQKSAKKSLQTKDKVEEQSNSTPVLQHSRTIRGTLYFVLIRKNVPRVEVHGRFPSDYNCDFSEFPNK